MNTTQAPTATTDLNLQLDDDLDQAVHATEWLDPEALQKLDSLSGWTVNRQANELNYKKQYGFKNEEAAKEFANSIGVFLKTNTVFVLVHQLLERPAVIVSMRANLSSAGALVLCEIADESERKYALVSDCTEDAA